MIRWLFDLEANLPDWPLFLLVLAAFWATFIYGIAASMFVSPQFPPV